MRLRFLSSFLAAGLSLLALSSQSRAATLTVTNTGDSGTGTLRQALTNANNETTHPGPDTIQFAPEVRGTITLATALPSLTSAIDVQGPGANILTVQRSTVTGTPSFSVFFVNTSAPVSIQRLTITGGESHTGGGVWGFSTLADALVKDCVVSGNTSLHGGGAGVAYVARVVNTLFLNNMADSTGGGGGYIGTGTLINCTFWNNRAAANGGALYSTGAPILANCTFLGNSAAQGGAAEVGPGASFSHCTFGGNVASGSGTQLSVVGSSTGTASGSRVRLDNSVFTQVGGTDQTNFFASNGATFVSSGNNIFEQNSLPFTLQPSDRSATNPLLSSTLQNNGGFVPTLALEANSPAINAANSTLRFDARGLARPGSAGNDVGAFEFGANTLSPAAQQGPDFVVNETGDDGDGVCGATSCTLREAVDAANAINDNSRISFADNVRGTIALTSGFLTVTSPLSIQGPGARLLALSGGDVTRHFMITSSASATISGLTMRDGRAPDDGFVNSSPSEITRSAGSINNMGTLVLTDCILDNNRAVGLPLPASDPFGVFGSFGRGGAILNAGSLTLRGCTLSNNLAQGGDEGGVGTGGAILSGSLPAHSLIMENCTLWGNTAKGTVRTRPGGSDGYSRGGAITVSGGTATFTNVTIAGNSSQGSTASGNGKGEGGGIVVGNATATAQNTLIAANEVRSGNTSTGSGPDVSGTLAGDYNLIGQAAGVTLSGSNNKVGVSNAKLGSFAFNGGSTPTVALLEGSPAINAANPYIKRGVDQRGVARPQAGRADIGAFELEFTPSESLVVTILTDEDDGTSDPSYGMGTSLREAINFANSNADANTIAFDPTVFNNAKTITLTLESLTIKNPLTLASPTAGTLTVTRAAIVDDLSRAIFHIEGGATARVTLSGLIISGGRGYLGSSVVNSGTLFLLNCRLTDSNSSSGGGGLCNYGTATVRFCTIDSNQTRGEGGGIYNSGTLLLSDCTISGNRSFLNGGGIANRNGNITASNCTIAGNSTQGYGGGVANDTSSGSINLLSSTIVGNNTVYGGGGVFAPAQSGFFTPPAPQTIVANTLIALNSMTSPSGTIGLIVSPDVAGSFISQDHNLVGNANGATGFTKSSDLVGTSAAPRDANIELSAGKPALQDNGGSTKTVRLLAGSAAINAGDPNVTPTENSFDQRGEGFARVKYGRIDIGAFEVQDLPVGTPTITLTPTDVKTKDTLTAKLSIVGVESNTLTYSYQWKKNGQILSGQTQNTLDLSIAGNGDKGDKISVVVTASGGALGTLTRESEAVTIQNSIPVAKNVTIDQKTPSTNTVLSFSVGSLTDDDGDKITQSYQWKKNGQSLNLQLWPTLDLGGEGNGDAGDKISMTLTVGDEGGRNTFDSDTVTVAEAPPLLERITIGPNDPRTNDTLTFTLPAEFQSQGLSLVYSWRKNNAAIEGETSSTLDLSKAGNGNKGDQISASVTVSDDKGNTTTVISNTVNVANTVPVITEVSIVPVAPTTDSVLSVIVTSKDDDNEELTTSYQWKNYSAHFGTESNLGRGATLDLSNPFNGDAGDRVLVVVTISDGTATVSQASPSVKIKDPTAFLSRLVVAPASPRTDSILTATATDENNPSTTFSYVWKKNDIVLSGESGSTLDLSKPGNGDKNDRISVVATPTNGQLSGPSVTAGAIVANTAPVLRAQAFAARENTPLTARIVGTDIDGDALTYALVTAPRYGKVALQSNGTFTYTPATNRNGIDGFQARVFDGTSLSSNAIITLNIAPANGAPVAANDALRGVEDVPLSIPAAALLRNDSNGEAPGEVDALSIVRVAVPAGFPGTLRLDVAKQTLLFTPKLNWNGTTSFSYTVQDSGRATATAQVTLQVVAVNDAPVALPGRFTVLSGTLGEFPLSGSDVEGDTLTFALSGKPTNGGARVVKVGDKWVVQYQSKVGFVGTDTLSIIARDGKLNSAPATITVTVKPNSAPLLVSLTPNKGTFASGSTLVFEQKVRDLNGTANLNAAALLIGNLPTVANARGGATLWFDATLNRFTLTKDDGVATLAPVALGGTLENSQVKVTLGAGDVVRDNYGFLTLKWRVTFKPAFTGIKLLWMRVEDLGGLSAGFTKSGDISLATTGKGAVNPSAPSS